MEKQTNKRNYFGALDGLRTFAILLVIVVHIKGGGKYNFSWHGIGQFIDNDLGKGLFLFMVISGFAMCCGYYEKIIKHTISLEEFYKKRYIKIWPFFALICIIDIIVAPSIDSLKELFANLTLCFGLLPNANISVVGVGWFLGLVFVFYMIFPFFCFLLSNKKRAIFAFVVALVFNILCTNYFFDANHVVKDFDARCNIVYCSVFFFLGAIIFLYKDILSSFSEKHRWIILGVCVASLGICLIIGINTFTMLLFFSSVLIYAIGDNRNFSVLKNPITKFISSISMEMFLCHMMFFRVTERIGVVHLFKNDTISFLVELIIVLAGTIVFSVVVQRVFTFISGVIKKGRNN